MRATRRQALSRRPAVDDQDQYPWRFRRRVAGKLGPPSGFGGRMRAPRAVHSPVEDGGSALHRNAAALHGAIACGADRLAGGCTRCGGRQRAGVDAQKAVPSMDHSRIGDRGRNFALGPCARGSRFISGSRHLPIWRAGGCNSRQDCLKRRNRRCCKWRRRSGTIRRRLSTGHSNVSLVFHRGNSERGHRDRTKWMPSAK